MRYQKIFSENRSRSSLSDGGKKIKCPDTLWLVRKIIDSKECREESEFFPGDDLFTPIERKTGIPVGNLTSQFFANLYLNGFDHFIKEELRQRYYIRYCDDFVLFGNSKAKLNDARIMIIDYLAALRLKMHENKSRVYRTAGGVDFLGYRIFPDHMAVRKSNVKKFRRKIVRLASDYRENRADLKTINASIQSWIGHVKHADSYRLREEVFSKAVFQRQQV